MSVRKESPLEKSIRTYLPVVKQWIDSSSATKKPTKKTKNTTDVAAQRKPLLVHGPYQSGKKSVLRQVLSRLGYEVIEPMAHHKLDEFVDCPLTGPCAYLIRTELLGLKRLPRVQNAPVVYVCRNPYDLGTKAEMNRRFQVLETKTGCEFSKRWGESAPRDSAVTYWQALDKIGAKPLDAEESLRAIELADGYLTEIVHLSYCNQGSATSIDQLAAAADAISLAETWTRKLPTGCVRFMDTITPIRICGMSSRSALIMQRPASDKKLGETDFEREIKDRKNRKAALQAWRPLTTVPVPAPAPAPVPKKRAPTKAFGKQSSSPAEGVPKQKQAKLLSVLPQTETKMSAATPVIQQQGGVHHPAPSAELLAALANDVEFT